MLTRPLSRTCAYPKRESGPSAGDDAGQSERLARHSPLQAPSDRDRLLTAVLDVRRLTETKERGGAEIVFWCLANEQHDLGSALNVMQVSVSGRGARRGRVLRFPVE